MGSVRTCNAVSSAELATLQTSWRMPLHFRLIVQIGHIAAVIGCFKETDKK
jgi:hypothetical protein